MIRQAISELLERVRAAQWPDRQIDLELARLAGHFKEVWDDERQTLVAFELDDGHWWTVGSEGQHSFDPDPYTSSLDVIVALIERELPGFSARLFIHPGASYADLYELGPLPYFLDGEVERRIVSPSFEGERHDARLPALVLCEAFLEALSAKLETTDVDDGE